MTGTKYRKIWSKSKNQSKSSQSLVKLATKRESPGSVVPLSVILKQRIKSLQGNHAYSKRVLNRSPRILYECYRNLLKVKSPVCYSLLVSHKLGWSPTLVMNATLNKRASSRLSNQRRYPISKQHAASKQWHSQSNRCMIKPVASTKTTYHSSETLRLLKNRTMPSSPSLAALPSPWDRTWSGRRT